MHYLSILHTLLYSLATIESSIESHDSQRKLGVFYIFPWCCRNVYYWRLREKPTIWAAVYLICSGRVGRGSRDLPHVPQVSTTGWALWNAKHFVSCWRLMLIFVFARSYLNISSHFISCPCGLYINTKVCRIKTTTTTNSFLLLLRSHPHLIANRGHVFVILEQDPLPPSVSKNHGECSSNSCCGPTKFKLSLSDCAQKVWLTCLLLSSCQPRSRLALAKLRTHSPVTRLTTLLLFFS